MNIVQIQDFIIQSRKDKGLTQAELGRRAGVTREMVSRFENGLHEIGIVKLQRICMALGLELLVRPGRGRPTVDDLDALFPDDSD